MTRRSLVTSSRETSARAIAARLNQKRRSLGSTPPIYVSDGIEVPKYKRRALLDLCPETLTVLLRCVRGELDNASANAEFVERLLVKALEDMR